MELAEQIRRIRQGDQAALNDVIRTYGADVYQRALAKTGSRETAKETTRQVISELIDCLKTDPEADGYELWIRALTEKSLLSRTEAETEALGIGGELGTQAEARAIVSEGEVPVYTPRRAREDLFAEAERPAQKTEPDPAPQRAAPIHRFEETGSDGARNDEYVRREREDAFIQAQRDHVRHRRERETEQVFHASKHRAGGLLIFIISVICLLLTWFAVGLMMRLGWIPAVDLGYVWFNQNVYLLF